ncbi:ABC transporter [Bifidobacterium aemilianum]|uniref:ABC transporter n=1 Tax=Bifidobacterium aemilianum TaxID=2493120 RepID=A0A366K6S7_9BIFI|nr:ABC transporter substrate-binding protein [Bifidobacterium aemilianum]RBP97450.1 ABC transporter [Bifidobacterium aemilianum]
MTKARITLAAALLPVIMVMSACGPATPSSQAPDPKAIISVNTVEPASPLIPSGTDDTAGWKVVTQLFEGLVNFDKKGNLVYANAQSITPNADASQYTIKLKPGLIFSNGEKITAATYATSWSFAANAANGQLGASIFSTITGYDQIQDHHGDPKAGLSGLTVVDDLTLRVDLKAPDSSFPYKVGDVAFLPLPSVAYKNLGEFGKHPVGDGPYRFKSWVPNQGIVIERNPDYQGPRKAKNGGIEFRDYQSLDAAYADVDSGHLDILDSVPVSKLRTFREDSDVQALIDAGPSFRSLTIPQDLAHFGGQEGALRRQAISQAMDRKQVTEKIFQGSVTPATDFTAPMIKGHTDKLTGSKVLSRNDDQARRLWKAADAISPWSGTFRIGYSADGTDKDWVDAVSHSISSALGIKVESDIFPTAKEFSTAINKRQIHSAFSSGIQSDYPHPEGYLVQGYSSSAADGKGLNHGDYKSPDFDALMAQAAAETRLKESIRHYQAAEDLLLKDLPVIPLWYRNVNAVAAKQVKAAPFGYMGLPIYNELAK